MLYTIFTVKDQDYKLRLGAKEAVVLEKKLGSNPLNIMVGIAQNNQIPELSVLLDILHASLVHFQHNITINDVYDLFDEYCDEGHSIVDLVPVVIDVFKVSGFFKEEEAEEEQEETEKNVK